jgi:hypothetical protein
VITWRKFSSNPELGKERIQNCQKKLQHICVLLELRFQNRCGQRLVGILRGGKPGPVVA